MDENQKVDAVLESQSNATLMKDSASIAIILVALGKTPEYAWELAMWTQKRLAGREYAKLLTLEDLRDFAEVLQ